MVSHRLARTLFQKSTRASRLNSHPVSSWQFVAPEGLATFSESEPHPVEPVPSLSCLATLLLLVLGFAWLVTLTVDLIESHIGALNAHMDNLNRYTNSRSS